MTNPTAAGTAGTAFQPGEWVADLAASTASFTVRNFGLRFVTGQVPLVSASVTVTASAASPSASAPNWTLAVSTPATGGATATCAERGSSPPTGGRRSPTRPAHVQAERGRLDDRRNAHGQGLRLPRPG